MRAVVSAAWVEALGTVGSVLVSAIYATLTWRMAKAADRQTAASAQQTAYLQGREREARERAAATLRARAAHLQRQVEKMVPIYTEAPSPRPEWRPADEHALEEAAEAVGGDTAAAASEIARLLELLRNHYAKMTEPPPQLRTQTLPAADRLGPDLWPKVRKEVVDRLAQMARPAPGVPAARGS